MYRWMRDEGEEETGLECSRTGWSEYSMWKDFKFSFVDRVSYTIDSYCSSLWKYLRLG